MTHSVLRQAGAVRIKPGGHYVCAGKEEMLVTGLGSCVAACIRDPVAKVGGMNHFMLPSSDSGTWGRANASMRFGNFAMERLINDILSRGGRRASLEVKVFGGANVMTGAGGLGHRNADFVENYLHEEGLQIAARHLRGIHPRRIQYFPISGRVRMLELPLNEAAVTEAEDSYARSLVTEPESGSMELF